MGTRRKRRTYGRLCTDPVTITPLSWETPVRLPSSFISFTLTPEPTKSPSGIPPPIPMTQPYFPTRFFKSDRVQNMRIPSHFSLDQKIRLTSASSRRLFSRVRRRLCSWSRGPNWGGIIVGEGICDSNERTIRNLVWRLSHARGFGIALRGGSTLLMQRVED